MLLLRTASGRTTRQDEVHLEAARASLRGHHGSAEPMAKNRVKAGPPSNDGFRTVAGRNGKQEEAGQPRVWCSKCPSSSVYVSVGAPRCRFCGTLFDYERQVYPKRAGGDAPAPPWAGKTRPR